MREWMRDVQIRDPLFGDLPLAQWSGDSLEDRHAEPWRSFRLAKQQRAQRDDQAAKATLHEILLTPNLESRHYLQAWHFLRGLGEQPAPEQAKHIYGVVIEVALQEGLEIVAAYEDRSARYFNYSGAGVVWEHPDASLDENVEALLAAGRNVVAQIGPWTASVRPHPLRVKRALTC